MKKYLVIVTVAVAVAMAFVSVKGSAAVEKVGKHDGVIKHIVLFKFKDSATPEQVREVVKRFADLKKQIPAIKAFEWGTNISPENKAEGFTHAFVLTFADVAGRDAYLPSAPHKAFGKFIGPYIDKVFVIDYKVQK